jgi:hypothetical protein
MFISQIDTKSFALKNRKNYYKLTHTRERERETEKEPGKENDSLSTRRSLVYIGPHVERLNGLKLLKIGPNI